MYDGRQGFSSEWVPYFLATAATARMMRAMPRSS